ncbi:cation tolerance protein CutA [Vibrio sp. 10N.286.49.B3]|uniref:flagellar brake protein n=1 Tax=Vibrio sp. 10N.286.49.B3 TaxID=1880855 RepID=UPI000C83704A|nr:flagellar brake protein [Vibrio sp. 10N.286.49.B3]PMH43143.1 cation tolerance protein CutA [Vibrio sp. 10N.286.49.B3]
MHVSAVKHKSNKDSSNITTINSTDALEMIEHSSEMTLNVTTPVGIKFITATKFIGVHSSGSILIETPNISDDDFSFYFQPGFWIKVKAFCYRGEGAVVQFRSQLQHSISEPLPMLMLSIPANMQIAQLRKETRYNVNLSAKASFDGNSIDCEIRDLSKGGCRFFTPPLGKPIQIGDQVSISVHSGTTRKTHFSPLKGKVCNSQKSYHYSRYGLEFNNEGHENVKDLLSHLKFDGTKLIFRN